MAKVVITRAVPTYDGTVWLESVRSNVASEPERSAIVDVQGVNNMLFDFTTGTSEENKLKNTLVESMVSAVINSGRDAYVMGANTKEESKRIARLAAKLLVPCVVQEFGTSIKEADSSFLSPGQEKLEQLYRYYKADFSTGLMPEVPDVPALDLDNLVEYKPKGLPKAIVVDIDGTIAHMTGRSPYDYSRVSEDAVDEVLRRMVLDYATMGYKVLFLSGRKSECREETVAWLTDALHPYTDFELHMRADGDTRPDFLTKYHLFMDNVNDRYDVEFVLDDREQVCRMWYRIGLKILRVGDPDSSF